MTLEQDSRLACRHRIFFNQCRYLEKRFPRLGELELPLTPNTAETTYTIYCRHIPSLDSFAADVEIAASFREILANTEITQIHPPAQRWLARHYLRRGMFRRVWALCADPEIVREADAMRHAHDAGYGADLQPYMEAKSKDRGASLIHYFSNHIDVVREKVIGHIAPEKNLRQWFAQRKQTLPCGYIALDGFQPGMDGYIDLVDTQLPGSMFDVIICHRVLEHIHDEHRALQELWRLLKPGGLLNISVPQTFALANAVDWIVPDPDCHGHVRQYGADFGTTLATAGFDVEIERWLLTRPSSELLERKAFPLLMYSAFKTKPPQNVVETVVRDRMPI